MDTHYTGNNNTSSIKIASSSHVNGSWLNTNQFSILYYVIQNANYYTLKPVHRNYYASEYYSDKYNFSKYSKRSYQKKNKNQKDMGHYQRRF